MMVEDGDLDRDQLHLGAAQYSADRKGKQVVRESTGVGSSKREQQEQRDEMDRQRMIQKVLKRAQIAKVSFPLSSRLLDKAGASGPQGRAVSPARRASRRCWCH